MSQVASFAMFSVSHGHRVRTILSTKCSKFRHTNAISSHKSVLLRETASFHGRVKGHVRYSSLYELHTGVNGFCKHKWTKRKMPMTFYWCMNTSARMQDGTKRTSTCVTRGTCEEKQVNCHEEEF